MKTPNRPDTRVIIDLNGAWEIEPGGRDTPPASFKHKIAIPSLVDCAEPPYDWQAHDFHWYRKTFHADESDKGRPAFLKIEQSMYGTAVWVNGNFAGESISCYTSQEYRVDGFLRYGAGNEVLARIGQRSTLPHESAVGKDQERVSYIPGIWGDVELVFTGDVRVKLVQTLPRIAESRVDVNVWLENLSGSPRNIILSGKVSEKADGSLASEVVAKDVMLGPASENKVSLQVPVAVAKLWSPESPFLYIFTATVAGSDGASIDENDVRFGMREFTIEGSDFLLNGRKIFPKGSNIAFHRFLSDGERRRLPWDQEWIRKLLIEIPKAHNFNFFRAHLGHMYNRWYDIADEGGMMLQDEWQFWGATGTREQITKEFTDWLKDNWNHPSIVIWDALNESSDNVVQTEIIPEMKKLDPTRSWESHDFFEDHPYIYSLGPVLVDRKLGYTRSLQEIEDSKWPSQVNEYLWWWLDKDFKPSELTKKVVTRWLGEDYSEDELIERQSFLASELTELFRRMRVRCIQPFVYLSMNEGPTSHWFLGDISGLRPKPVLAAVKNAFEPFGVSIELWDRHFYQGEKRNVTVYVFNDYPKNTAGSLRCGLKSSGGEWISNQEVGVEADASSHRSVALEISFPEKLGDYKVCAELTDSGTRRKAASSKFAHVYDIAGTSSDVKSIRVGVIDEGSEVLDFLISVGIEARKVGDEFDGSDDSVLVVGSAGLRRACERMNDNISRWVEEGHAVIFLEPERDAGNNSAVTLPGGRRLETMHREDAAEGGYDSYVIPTDISHPIWRGIRKADLQMFNGKYGGEIVPQTDLIIGGEHEILARSGLGLSRPVVLQARLGKGYLVVSSVEIGGRLVAGEDSYDNLYAARPDPIAQRFILNVVRVYAGKP